VWQQVVLSEQFKQLWERKRRIRFMFQRLISSLIVSQAAKVDLLYNVPLCAGMSSSEVTRLAQMTYTTLVPRYHKVQRAHVRPSAFHVVVFGVLQSVDEGGKPIRLRAGAGGSFGDEAMTSDANDYLLLGNGVLVARVTDVITSQPTLLLRLERCRLETKWWWQVIQERHLERQTLMRIKALLLHRAPLMSGAEFHLCQELAELFAFHQIKPGSLIFEEGDKPDSVYLLLQGEVRVLKASGRNKPPRVLATILGANERHSDDTAWIGANALFARTARPYSVESTQPCQLMCIARDHFDAFGTLVPTVVSALRITSRQIEQEGRSGEASYQHLRGLGQELTIKAQLRLEQQADHMQRWRAAQHRTSRTEFIYSLAAAYEAKKPVTQNVTAPAAAPSAAPSI